MASDAIKMARALEKLAKLTATMKGEEAPELDRKQLVAAVKEEKASRPRASDMDAEAVLLVLRQPAAFTYKVCKRVECKEPFGTNYHSVAYCSNRCRAKDLLDLGVTWDPSKTEEERWAGEPPLMIPPAAVKVLRRLLATLPDDDSLSPYELKHAQQEPIEESETDTDETTPVPLNVPLEKHQPEQHQSRFVGLDSLLFGGAEV